MPAMIEVRNVTKAYGGVTANEDVSMDVVEGGITGLIGPNGSGKTTLFNSIVGYHPIDAGSIKFRGQEISKLKVPEIARLGMLRTFQQTRIYGNMDCVKNMLISVPHRNMRVMEIFGKYSAEDVEKAEHLLEFVGLYSKRKLMAGDLSFGQQKLLEFAMALMNEPQVLLLDEPTTALGPDEVEALHRTVAACRARGIGVVYVSHRLPEVLDIADRITVLRDGRNRGTFDAASTTESALVELIVGRPFEAAFPPATPTFDEDREVLVVDGLQGQSFGPVSFTLQSGEIVGVAGAEGNGQAALFDCLAGRVPPKAGRVVCDGEELSLVTTHEAVNSGIMLLPGDRKHEALMPVLGVRVNATIQSLRRFSLLGILRRRAERRSVGGLVDELEIRTPSLEQPVQFLSGGNQQKVSVSRSFLKEPAVILAYEPTQGVDVGSRFDIYTALRARTDSGAGMLVKSSDPLELSGLCDRVLVMSRGQVIEEIPGEELDERRIVEAIVRGPGLSKAGRSPFGAAMPKATNGSSAP
jgi:ribose transport system ATP-binding protein